MRRPARPQDRSRDGVIILALLGLFFFASPFTDWWAGVRPVWYFPFVLWGALIGLIALAQWLGRSFED